MVNTIYLSPIAIKSSDLFHTVHLVSIERLGFAFFFPSQTSPQITRPKYRPQPSSAALATFPSSSLCSPFCPSVHALHPSPHRRATSYTRADASASNCLESDAWTHPWSSAVGASPAGDRRRCDTTRPERIQSAKAVGSSLLLPHTFAVLISSMTSRFRDKVISLNLAPACAYFWFFFFEHQIHVLLYHLDFRNQI
jgi:hypothetical protein